MASVDRKYRKGQPVAIIARYGLKLPLLEHPELKTLMAWLLVRHAARCRVEVIDWCLLDTHLHLTVSQQFTGHDRRRRKGVAPFIRNVQSQFVLQSRRLYRIEGLRSEGVYRSQNLCSNLWLLAKQVYTAANLRRHTGLPQSRATFNSWRAHTARRPDGVVTGLPSYLQGWSRGLTWRVFTCITDRAMRLMAQQTPQAWVVATAEVATRLDLDIDLEAAPEIVAATEVFDPAEQRKARRRRLRGRLAPEFHAYPAPRLSAALTRLGAQARNSGPP